ncbi:putative oxidoreductase [Gordonia effusa NBRC 100432]|uniref:Putative oxidoreductase n=1 Tax=Gordonia effusa NBRC 100432 TaxID=1077974 RepID=H0QUV8_9ACTN|nr:NADH:flavin oxidoreductase [Gordonia effusa]GAB16609.1 putative oxidoreductase [Gordonia effusa NBRC 100432]
MTDSFGSLLEPFASRNLTLPNRIVMAPMTRMFSPGGVPGADVAEYYRKRAAGGVGLIVTEGAYIPDPAVGPGRRIPHLYGDDAAAGWAKVVEQVHAEGGKIVPQLWHLGVVRGDNPKYRPEVESVSPSGLALDGTPLGRALTAADIDALIDAYVKAAKFAVDVGFDGLELHGAHGYLLDQFLWRKTNRRTDEYGVPTAFPTAVVRAVRGAVGPDFAIIYRFSQWKSDQYDARIADTPGELGEIVTALTDAGVDILHASTRRFGDVAFPDADEHLTLAGWTRKLSSVPTITVGSVGLDQVFTSAAGVGSGTAAAAGIDTLLTGFDTEQFDLVAVGRALLSDPDWVHKHADGRADEIVAYDPTFRDRLI